MQSNKQIRLYGPTIEDNEVFENVENFQQNEKHNDKGHEKLEGGLDCGLF